MLTGMAALAVAAASADLACRYVPWIDPLFRVRSRLPKSSSGRPRCAITFDDGPCADSGRVLDVLRAAGVRATFFVLARNAERWPDLLRRTAAEGHTIGIHGTTHRTLEFASAVDAEREIGGAIARLTALGVEPAPLYRSPHGRKSLATLRVAGRLGLATWAWSRGIYDTRGAPAEQLELRAARAARDRLVLLLHDGRDDEAAPDLSPLIAALPRILDNLSARAFEFTTLDGV